VHFVKRDAPRGLPVPSAILNLLGETRTHDVAGGSRCHRTVRRGRTGSSPLSCSARRSPLRPETHRPKEPAAVVVVDGVEVAAVAAA
jgi:hypothetical protein